LSHRQTYILPDSWRIKLSDGINPRYRVVREEVEDKISKICMFPLVQSTSKAPLDSQ